jgi:putative chitinase
VANFDGLLTDVLGELRDILGDILKKRDKAASKPTATYPFNEDTFFDDVRETVFGGRLTQGQVDGTKAKLSVLLEKGVPLSHAAYILATSFHETARRMQAVREGLNASDDWRRRNLRYYPWYGRGDVQLTWERNYAFADKRLGLKGRLVSDPDLALNPDISTKVLIVGMQEGWFTKHRLVDYLPNETGDIEEFVNARRIVNSTDKALLIAGIAVKFQLALKKAGYHGSSNHR